MAAVAADDDALERPLAVSRTLIEIALAQYIAAMLAVSCLRPTAVRATACRQKASLPVLCKAAQPLASRLQHHVDGNAALLRPAAVSSLRPSSRSVPTTVAQAAAGESAGELRGVGGAVRCALHPQCGPRRVFSASLPPASCRRRHRLPPNWRRQLAPAAAPAEEEGGKGKTLYLGFLFGLWYLFNIQFNM